MLTTREHYLTANLGNVYLFTLSLQVDEAGYPRRPGILQCPAYGRQLLQSIAESWWDDALNRKLWKLWLDVFPTPWDQPTGLYDVIEDLAEAIGRGDLRVYLEYSPTEEGMWQQMAERAAATVSKTSSHDTSPEVAEQPRTRKSVERPPQDSNKGSAAGAIPRAPTAEPDPVQERRERYEERQELVSETAANPDVDEANERLEFNNDNIIRAEAAQYTYKVDAYNRGQITKDELPKPPIGLNGIDPNSKGLDVSMLTDEESGFGAALFESEINGETMLAFKGTQSGTDWKANIGQAFGRETEQYNKAMELADFAQDSALNNDFSIVGHSLGGGLTSAAVALTGQQGYTFNSAGLHPSTASEQGGMDNNAADRHIQTQSVQGDILTMVQENDRLIGAGLGGTLGSLLGGTPGGVAGATMTSMLLDLPEALGNHRSLPSVNGGTPLERHKMDQVIAGIEYQKKADIQTLEQSR